MLGPHSCTLPRRTTIANKQVHKGDSSSHMASLQSFTYKIGTTGQVDTPLQLIVSLFPLAGGSGPCSSDKVCCSPDKFLDPEHSLLYTWLCIGIVVLDAFKELAQAPVAISFNIQHR
eukprot:GHUV01056445.1.p4 GENE.GHUV01056445.1~~GHUV01056445.1.p4  ORF type:complete len:117 (-),score=24.32 GHUV01056445.1:414-764(-)